MANLKIIEGNMSDAVGRRSLAVNARYIRGYGVPKYKSDADRARLVAAARSYIGCKEADGTHRPIIDLYNSHKPLARGYTVKYTDAWCATFVSAMAVKCNLTDIIPTECGCEKQINLFKALGEWVENDAYVPKPGDIIFYDWQDSGVGDCTGAADHVGIVETSPIELNLTGTEDKPAEAPAASYFAEGIDVSKWQAAIDFEKVKAAGKDFVIARAGIGTSTDTYWERNYANAKAAGLKVGAYWFHDEAGGDTVERALIEASACLERLKGKRLDFPVYYDLEVGDSSKWNAMAYAFCQKLEAAGYFVGVYTSESFLKNFDDAFKKRFTLWVANWSRKPAVGAIWQKSSKGSVPGITGDVDLDEAYQDFPTVIQDGRLNGYGSNDLPDEKPATAPPTAPTAPAPEPATADKVMELATKVIHGEFGNGDRRKALLGDNYAAVQSEVNHRLTASVDELAKEVIAGRYGNGQARKEALGYRFGVIQTRVNELLKG